MVGSDLVSRCIILTCGGAASIKPSEVLALSQQSSDTFARVKQGPHTSSQHLCSKSRQEPLPDAAWAATRHSWSISGVIQVLHGDRVQDSSQRRTYPLLISASGSDLGIAAIVSVTLDLKLGSV